MEMSYRKSDNQALLRDNRLIGATIAGADKRKSGSDVGGLEKTPFLPSEPVKLTPAWESSNLPNDTLNFKNIAMDMVPPVDRYGLIYITLVLHGLGTLTPWNMFITAKNYFVVHKLGETSIHASNFMAYVGFAAQVPNVILNWVNIFVPLRGNLTTRIIFSLTIEVIIFIFTVILAMVDSSSWRDEFFWITMVSVVILNAFNGIFQNTVFGVAARLPPKYTGAVILGNNLAGVVTALLSMLARSVAPSERTAAVYYFLAAILVMLACFDTFFALPLNRFYRYHDQMATISVRENQSIVTVRPPYWKVFKQSSLQLFNVFFIFSVTLFCFPAINSDIRISDPDFVIPHRHFTEITCFITFNVFAAIGAFFATLVAWPKPKFLIIPVLLRAVFVPLFLVCNYQPLNTSRVMPVWINNDWAYWAIAAFMALTSGYFSSVAMMYVGKNVSPAYASTAGMFGGAFLITGILAGVLLSMLGPLIVTMSVFAST